MLTGQEDRENRLEYPQDVKILLENAKTQATSPISEARQVLLELPKCPKDMQMCLLNDLTAILDPFACIHAETALFLAQIYKYGVNQSQLATNLPKAFYYYELGAKLGELECCYKMAIKYFMDGQVDTGKSVCRRSAELLFYLTKGAYGIDDGKNGFEQDVESGVAWLKKSVESASEQYPHGLYELALLYQSGKVDPIVPKNTEIMLELLEKGKSLNSCQSFLFMAKIYENGDYGVEKSYDTAYRHYLSASKTSIEAKFQVAFFMDNRLIPKDALNPPFAFTCCLAAAKAGHLNAMALISKFLDQGFGINPDKKAAAAWLRVYQDGLNKLTQSRHFVSSNNTMYPQVRDSKPELANMSRRSFGNFSRPSSGSQHSANTLGSGRESISDNSVNTTTSMKDLHAENLSDRKVFKEVTGKSSELSLSSQISNQPKQPSRLMEITASPSSLKSESTHALESANLRPNLQRSASGLNLSKAGIIRSYRSELDLRSKLSRKSSSSNNSTESVHDSPRSVEFDVFADRNGKIDSMIHVAKYNSKSKSYRRALEVVESILTEIAADSEEREYYASRVERILEYLAQRDSYSACVYGRLLSRNRKLKFECKTAFVQNNDKAIECFVYGAKRDHPESAYQASILYFQEKRFKLGHFFLQKAAKLGHPGAMCNLGTYQITGENGFSIDVIQGVKWLSRSAQEATKEYPKGLYEYALLHENGLYPSLFKDHSFMISLLQEACRFDDPDAHIKCAQGYEAELWGLIRSPEDAIVHYQRAALKKHPEALYQLALYYDGNSTKPRILKSNPNISFQYAENAARLGHLGAMNLVSSYLKLGYGCAKDANAASKWSELAYERHVLDSTEKKCIIL